MTREGLRRVLTAGAVVSSVLGALLAARASARCGVPEILPLCLGTIGLLAFFGLFWRARSGSLAARTCVWALIGGLLATAIVGVMSVLPWALVAGGLLLLAALLDRPEDGTERLAAAGSFVVFAALTFTVLYQSTIRWGIDEVRVPAQSSVTDFLSPIDYADAFRVEVPASVSPGGRGLATTLIRSLRPCWIEPPAQELLDSMDPSVGSDVGGWPIYGLSEDELVAGLNRSFIDLRLSILIMGSGADRSVVVSTIARFNNSLGRLYFVPVRLAHRIVLADAMRAIRANVEE